MLESTVEGESVSNPSVYKLLVSATTTILQTPVDPARTLVAQGLDSLGAVDLLEALNKHGYEADYEYLLSDASIESLVTSLREKTQDGPSIAREDLANEPFALTGPQALWAYLEQQGWGTWANISLCLSMPASVIPAARLPAIVQFLCDANDAMRMVLTRSPADGKILQQRIPGFHVPVKLLDAPVHERDAMRLIEAFEGEEMSPFEPSTRALVLSSATNDGRHWLCLTMHHIFSDRISMQSLARQIKDMITKAQDATQHPIGYVDFALWHNEIANGTRARLSQKGLQGLLSGADTSPHRPIPQLANPEMLNLGDLPAVTILRPSEGKALEALAVQLETTLPLLLHALLSLLVARLTDDESAISGQTDLLLCHVVSNRERHTVLKDMVGCFDTSVPVAVHLTETDTLETFCAQTRLAFAGALKFVPDLARGGWITPTAPDESPGASLFDRFSHINIVRSPQQDTQRDDDPDIREHPVRRVQQTRWGLLLRVTLPPPGRTGPGDQDGISISAFAEDRALANVAQYCFVELLRTLLGESQEGVGGLHVLGLVDRIVDRAAFASAQLRHTSALVRRSPSGQPFIYEKLVARQKRWYEHNDRFELCRDAHNRFIGTAANPFPFTQLDKLKERQFLEAQGVPLPRLIHILEKQDLRDTLVALAPDLSDSFVIKPVGAGHSFGVTLVRNGVDLSRNGTVFNASVVAAELSDMAEREFCVHEGHVFPFNFSSFLIEELVVDERGFSTPTDYKVFVIGEKLLWIQLHFKADGHTWVAFVDEDFRLLPQPAWDPTTCWRTHRALVCTDQDMVDVRKPDCLLWILEHSRRLGERMGIFVRLDWYADRERGPLMGEVTTFPHILQPRSFYTAWANDVVKAAWQDPDGVAPQHVDESDNHAARINAILSDDKPAGQGLEDFIPTSSALWAAQDNLTFDTLRTYVAKFDLAPWGVAAADRVALLVGNGVQLGALLLATMNRYIVEPIGDAHPASFIADQLQETGVGTLVVIGQTEEAQKAWEVAHQIDGLKIIELVQTPSSALPQLPLQSDNNGLPESTPARGIHDKVLVLRTSGSTGEPKCVSYSLVKLMRAGAMIAQSLHLSSADLGISMLPLHHIGGIACNLVAPLLVGSSMQFRKAFDPRTFFDAIGGPQGATWCYLVPAMWDMVLKYSNVHPQLGRTKPWPRLRAIRSAGSDLHHDLAVKLAELFGNNVHVLPTYGMTEAMPIAAPPVSYRLDRPGSVGRILPTVSVEIIDPTEGGGLQLVEDGIVGEVTVRGPTVMDGYDQDDPSASTAFTPRGYFRTGDLGNLVADGSGWLFIKGRMKDAINRGGETIAPAEIETALWNYPGWQDAGDEVQLMAFARAHEDLGEDVALAVAPETTRVDIAQLNSWAQQRLPVSMVPKTIVTMPELPRSETSKLLRARFAEQINAQLPASVLGTLEAYTLDRDRAVPKLVEAIRLSQTEAESNDLDASVTLDAVLMVVRDFVGGHVDIGPDTRLEDAGVNSLAAVDLSGRLNDRFRSQLPTWVVSDHPTPRALFSQLVEAQTNTANVKNMSQSTVSRSTPARRLRMLFLHGEGSDVQLMDLSLQATHWTGLLKSHLEFVFLDAPHLCAPKPEFHPAAVEAGVYDKKTYRSWGATAPETLEASITAVNSAFEKNGPIDAIGGICDGGLVAALIASQRPDLKLLLNISSSPLARLPAATAQATWAIKCPTVHLISHQDELHSFSQLLEIPARCESPVVLEHDSGHAVPRLKDSLKNEIFSIVESVTVTK